MTGRISIVYVAGSRPASLGHGRRGRGRRRGRSRRGARRSRRTARRSRIRAPSPGRSVRASAASASASPGDQRRPARGRPGRTRRGPAITASRCSAVAFSQHRRVARPGGEVPHAVPARPALAQLEPGLDVGEDADAVEQVVEVGGLDQVEAGELLHDSAYGPSVTWTAPSTLCGRSAPAAAGRARRRDDLVAARRRGPRRTRGAGRRRPARSSSVAPAHSASLSGISRMYSVMVGPLACAW